MKKILTALSAFVLCLVMPLAFIGCGTTKASQSVELSMNPEIVFHLDANNKVTSVTYKNEDANQIFVNVNFTGMDIEKAIEQFVDYSLISGHLNLNGEEVDFKSLSKDNAALTSLNAKVQTAIQNAFDNIGVAVTPINESVSDMANAWADLYEEVREIAPEKSIVELKDMSAAELIGVLDQKQKEYAGIAYNQMDALENQITALVGTFNIENLNTFFNNAQDDLVKAQNKVNQKQTELNNLKKQHGSDNVLVQTAQSALDFEKEILKTTKSALAQAKENFNEAVKQFKAQVNELVANAKAQYAQIQTTLKAQYKTAVDANKTAVQNHLNAAVANQTITAEQAAKITALIEKYQTTPAA